MRRGEEISRTGAELWSRDERCDTAGSSGVVFQVTEPFGVTMTFNGSSGGGDPLAGFVGIVFAFPDGDAGFAGVDDEAAGIEGGVAVSGYDFDPDG